MVRCCPRCRAENDAHGRFYTKQGYFKTLHNHQPVPRYRCRHCGKHFSSRTGTTTYRQHKPEVNRQVYAVLCSGVTFRRAAKILNVARVTIKRKFYWLTIRAQRAHAKNLLKLKKEQQLQRIIQFDEMESYERSRLYPLSIALAVTKGGSILDARIARMRPKGQLARLFPWARRKWNKDNRTAISKQVLKRVSRLATPDVEVRCDEKTTYPRLIKQAMPEAEVTAKSRKHDEDGILATLNHVAAKIRADLARMRRKSWARTWKLENLQRHLYLYIAWNNGYQIAA